MEPMDILSSLPPYEDVFMCTTSSDSDSDSDSEDTMDDGTLNIEDFNAEGDSLFNMLPYELIIYIMKSFFSAQELISGELDLVCWRWNYASRDKSIWLPFLHTRSTPLPKLKGALSYVIQLPVIATNPNCITSTLSYIIPEDKKGPDKIAITIPVSYSKDIVQAWLWFFIVWMRKSTNSTVKSLLPRRIVSQANVAAQFLGHLWGVENPFPLFGIGLSSLSI